MRPKKYGNSNSTLFHKGLYRIQIDPYVLYEGISGNSDGPRWQTKLSFQSFDQTVV